MNLEEKDYVVGMATTPKSAADAAQAVEAEEGQAAEGEPSDTGTEASPLPAKKEAAAEPEVTDEAVKGTLILSVTENGFGKRTPADSYRLQRRGGYGVINVKTTERTGKVVGIAQVDEDSQVMLISQYGKVIRMDSTTIRESGRNAQGVRLLHMEPGDRVAAAVVIAPEEEANGNGGTLIQ